jgi:hypothetical protein
MLFSLFTSIVSMAKSPLLVPHSDSDKVNGDAPIGTPHRDVPTAVADEKQKAKYGSIGRQSEQNNVAAKSADIAMILCWLGLHSWQHTLRSRYMRGALIHCERCGIGKPSR